MNANELQLFSKLIDTLEGIRFELEYIRVLIDTENTTDTTGLIKTLKSLEQLNTMEANNGNTM